MKKFLFSSSLLLIFLMVNVAFALPVIPTNEVSEWKLTNFETFIDNNNNGLIDAGDDVYGIMKITTINNLAEDITTFNQNSGQGEISGEFQFSVTGGSIDATPGSSGSLSFALETGDYWYLNYSTTENWDGTVANAQDGDLWIDIRPGTFYEGVNNSAGLTSLNFNWANLTTNNTGYTFVPMDWPSANGSLDLGHVGGIIDHSHGHVSEIYMETKLTPLLNDPNGWLFSSQDPLNAYVVPEPGTMILLGFGLLGFAGAIRRKS